MKRLLAMSSQIQKGVKLSEVAHVETKGRINTFRGRNDGLGDHLSTEHTACSDWHE